MLIVNLEDKITQIGKEGEGGKYKGLDEVRVGFEIGLEPS